ncbi:basic proline-rich protein-like [Manis pentadactyla]|uniref:basic proline-rich protein-like n=1 Tax=Manis pentadactyla TaxID=143292 RepID=UPI00255CF708|nr:basic proline-rich protein-like [Manis pentadactyla]XP_057348296.1 basic proline-rich protein-like [Manis pentadactyla]XP_057348297.1 basic proline-rich protein-like [Manis pentadactyla]XP_057348298.1 basic proline-rich protein-like [Manis pentadactyla]
MLHREGRVGLLRLLSVVRGRGSALRRRDPLAADAAHARPAGQRRPPCFFPKVRGQLQQRKPPTCARPSVLPAPPPPRPSPADATGARQSRAAFQQRPPAASSRLLQGPPSPGTGALFLTQACAPRSGSSRGGNVVRGRSLPATDAQPPPAKAKGLRRRFLSPNRSYHPRSPPPACPRQPVSPADTRPCRLPPPPPSNAFFPLTLTFAAFASAH